MVLRAHDIMMLFVFLCSTLALQDFVLTTNLWNINIDTHARALHCTVVVAKDARYFFAIASLPQQLLTFDAFPLGPNLSRRPFRRSIWASFWKTLRFAHNHGSSFPFLSCQCFAITFQHCMCNKKPFHVSALCFAHPFFLYNDTGTFYKRNSILCKCL